jgi:uncharacterized protein
VSEHSEEKLKNEIKQKIEDVPPAETYKQGQPIKVVVKAETDIGYKVIVDQKYWGVIHYDDVFQGLTKNEHLDAFVLRVREDGKLDVTIYKPGNKGSDDIGELIMDELRACDGFLDITAKTDPKEIYDLFGVSKKKFKMALGSLYKQRLIEIKDDGVHLVVKKTK